MSAVENDETSYPESDLLNVGEAAKFLRMSRTSLYRLIKRKRISWVDVPGARGHMFLPDQLEEFLESTRVDRPS